MPHSNRDPRRHLGVVEYDRQPVCFTASTPCSIRSCTVPGAVRIYRSCRRAGVTPRGLVGCMIVAVASGTATPVLAHDRDFARIAERLSTFLTTGTPLRP